MMVPMPLQLYCVLCTFVCFGDPRRNCQIAKHLPNFLVVHVQYCSYSVELSCCLNFSFLWFDSSRNLSDVLLKKPAIQSSPPHIQSSPSNSKTPPTSSKSSLLRKLLSSVSPENADSAATGPSGLQERSPAVKHSTQRSVLSDRSNTTLSVVSMSDVVLSGEESSTSATLSPFPSAFVEDDSSAVCSEPPPLEVRGQGSGYDGMPDLEVHDHTCSTRSHLSHRPVSRMEQRGQSSTREDSNEKLLEYALSLKPKPAGIGRGRALMQLVQQQSRELASSAIHPTVTASSAIHPTESASSAIHPTESASSATHPTVTASSATHPTVTASSAIHPTESASSATHPAVTMADQSRDSHLSTDGDSCDLGVGPTRLEGDGAVISDTQPQHVTRSAELSMVDETQTSISELALGPGDAIVANYDYISQSDFTSSEDIVTSHSLGPDELSSVDKSLVPESASDAPAIVVSAPEEHCSEEDIETSDVSRPAEFLSGDGAVTSDTELSYDYMNQPDPHSAGDTETSLVTRPSEHFSEDNFSPEEQVTNGTTIGGDTRPEEADDAATRNVIRPTELSTGAGDATIDTEEIPVVDVTTHTLEQSVLDHDAVSPVFKCGESSVPNIPTSAVVTRPTELRAEGGTETRDVTRPVELFAGGSGVTSDSESDTEPSVVNGTLEQPAVSGKDLARPAEPATVNGSETSVVESQSPGIDITRPDEPLVDNIPTSDSPRQGELSRVTELAVSLFPNPEEPVTVDDHLSTGVELPALDECDATRPTEFFSGDGAVTSDTELSYDYMNQPDLHSDGDTGTSLVTRPSEHFLEDNFSPEEHVTNDTTIGGDTKPEEADVMRPTGLSTGAGAVTSDTEEVPVVDDTTHRLGQSDDAVSSTENDTTASLIPKLEECASPNDATFTVASRPAELAVEDVAETSDVTRPAEISTGKSGVTSDSESGTEPSVTNGSLEQTAVNNKDLARPAELSTCTVDGTETSTVESQSPGFDMTRPDEPLMDNIPTSDTPRLGELSRVTELAVSLFPNPEEPVTVGDDLSTGVELPALDEYDATRPTELLIEDGGQTSGTEDSAAVDDVVTRPEQHDLYENATSDTNRAEDISTEGATGTKPMEPVPTDDTLGGVTRPSELTAVTDVLASDAVSLCSPEVDTASSEVTRLELSSVTRPTELLTGDGAGTSDTVSPTEGSVGTGPGALSVSDTGSGHVTRPVSANHATATDGNLLLLPPKFFETSRIELPTLTMPRDISQIVERESSAPLSENETLNSQLTNEDQSLATGELQGGEGEVPSDPVGVTPHNRTADSAVTHPSVEKQLTCSSGKRERRIKMAAVFPSTPSTLHTPTPTRPLFTPPTAPPITPLITTPNTLPTVPPNTPSTAPHSTQDSDRATVDAITDRDSVHSPASDKPLAVKSGDGRVDSGDGTVETGDGRVETGDGRVDSDDGRVDSGDGRVETGDGRVETGDGRVETGDGRVDSGDGRVKTGDGGVADSRGNEVGTRREGDIPALESVHGDSSDEGARFMGGRSQDQIEQSIATYQRNTRRWQVGVAC